MKNMKKQLVAGLLLLAAASTAACSGQTDQQSGTAGIASANENEAVAAVSESNPLSARENTDFYTFELDENVNRTSVTYPNRYGIEIAADLYTAKDLDESQQYPALVIGPPYGGVKEQSPGIYANQLAQRGFVVIAFDPAYMGESGGEPRNISSPEIFVDNFSAGVDYLGSLPYVDREQIGAIGICGSGGFAVSAAQVDPRIKAVATASMYDMSRAMKGGVTAETLDQLSRQRWTDMENGIPEYIPTFPAEPVETVPEGLDDASAEFFSYYGLARGHHPNARGGFTTTSMMPFINFDLLDRIDTISPRPILFIAGDNAHSLFFSEDAYAAAAEPKELYIVPDVIHIDLYVRVDKIPFDKIESFFKEAFA